MQPDSPLYLTYTTRPFSPAEKRFLSTMEKKLQKEIGGKIKFYHFIIAGCIGAAFTWLATLVPDSIWTFLFGVIAVIAFAFIVFAPYELYKARKKGNSYSQEIRSFLDKGTADTCVIRAKRIALAGEFEDEGDIYIIELENKNLLYLWDYDYTLQKIFPCLYFEIFEDSYYQLTGRLVNPLSEKFQPVYIDKKAKWNYMGKIGLAEHLSVEQADFALKVDEINSFT